MSFTFNQSIYNKDNLAQVLNHKINQSIIYSDNGGSKLSDLENELLLYYKYGSISNRLLFNHQDNIIINSSSSASFNMDNFLSNIYYNYSKDTSSLSSTADSYSYKDLPNSESFSYDLSYKFNKFYTVTYKEEYDLVTEIAKIKEYTLNIDKKCWAFDIKLVDNLVASATISNNAIRQKIFYIQLTLKPIVTLNQEYIQNKTGE